MALTQEFLQEMKGQLEVEKKRLEDELSRFAKSTGVAGDYETQFPDMGTDEDEHASEVEQYVDDIALEANLESQLKDAMDALMKIEAGNYGVCEVSGEAIPEERLRIYPAARTAIHR